MPAKLKTDTTTPPHGQRKNETITTLNQTEQCKQKYKKKKKKKSKCGLCLVSIGSLDRWPLQSKTGKNILF